MAFVTTVEEDKQKLLIIEKTPSVLSENLRLDLKKYNLEVQTSSEIPEKIEDFSYLFFIDTDPNHSILKNNKLDKIVLIFTDRAKALSYSNWARGNKSLEIKTIHINSLDDPKKDQVEKILWFSFSKNSEAFLPIESATKKKEAPIEKDHIKKIKGNITKKKIILISILIFVLYHLLVFPFIFASSYFLYRATGKLKAEDLSASRQNLKYANTSHKIAEFFYNFSRPTYLLLSLALFPDNFMQINEKAQLILDKSIVVYENSNEMLKLILKKDKKPDEKQFLVLRIKNIESLLLEIEENISYIVDKIPEFPQKAQKIKHELQDNGELFKKLTRILPHIRYLLAENSTRKYLLLFANNMELRPGGGFIGSFGILTMKDLTLDNLEIYDVYDADGQLTAHVEPPLPIRRYLDQPNWFLRDSAFSSDFAENYRQARFFLDRELGPIDLSGGVLITTTSIQNILDSFGSIKLNDFNETVTKDNFYIKAQLYAENKFFPGSIQKKSFLGSLTRHILINLEEASISKLSQGLKKSLDEKQLVMYFENPELQDILDSLYWSGKTVVPTCPSPTACTTDYIFPVDANLGVNKANFLVTRNLNHRIKIDPTGKVENTFTINLSNASEEGIFPGGKYKNYFQMLLPRDSEIKKITKNGVEVKDYDQETEIFRKIGFLVEIEPRSAAELIIEYRLTNPLISGKQIYQLVAQKQIGSKNSDFSLEIILPSNVRLLNQNFSPLVKDNRIFYNTTLTADKIFLLELVKNER